MGAGWQENRSLDALLPVFGRGEQRRADRNTAERKHTQNAD
jgi:hypothetical protein